MKRLTSKLRLGAVISILALIDLGSGCATTKAVTDGRNAAANRKIQIVFDNATPTDYFECKSADPHDCHFVGPYSMAERFQRSGTVRLAVPSDCLGSFFLIQIENIDVKPEAHVLCAQPR